MRSRNTIASVVGLMLAGMTGGRIREPSPEKYPGQRSRYRECAWRGDGVASKVPTKADRNRRREQRRVQRQYQAVCAPASTDRSTEAAG